MYVFFNDVIIVHSAFFLSPGSNSRLLAKKENSGHKTWKVFKRFFTIIVKRSNILRQSLGVFLQTLLSFEVQQSIFDLVALRGFFVVLKSRCCGGHLFAMRSRIEVMPFHEGPLFTSGERLESGRAASRGHQGHGTLVAINLKQHQI